MKLICLALVVLFASVAQSQFVFSGNLAPNAPGDIAGTSGITRVRTDGDTLFFDSQLFNVVDITAVHLHLTPGNGAINGGPLLLALTNTSASVGLTPLSSQGSNALVQSGTRNTANLLASPQLAAARAQVVALGLANNLLQNIGDIDRLLRAGVVYSDVHSLTRPSPMRVMSGGVFTIPTTSAGRKLLSN